MLVATGSVVYHSCPLSASTANCRTERLRVWEERVRILMWHPCPSLGEVHDCQCCSASASPPLLMFAPWVAGSTNVGGGTTCNCCHDDTKVPCSSGSVNGSNNSSGIDGVSDNNNTNRCWHYQPVSQSLTAHCKWHCHCCHLCQTPNYSILNCKGQHLISQGR